MNFPGESGLLRFPGSMPWSTVRQLLGRKLVPEVVEAWVRWWRALVLQESSLAPEAIWGGQPGKGFK